MKPSPSGAISALRIPLLWLVFWLAGVTRLAAALLELPSFEPDPAQVAYLQRAITLLNSGTPDHKPTFRLLFYGNSHMTQPWCYELAEELKAFYPNVHFVVTNKALVALENRHFYHSEVADIGPWQPDLVILTSYGAFGDPDLGERNDYIPLYQRLRSLSISDVLVFPPHLNYPGEIAEPWTPPDDPEESLGYLAYYIRLPRWANAAGHCWANIRTPWKQYLIMHDLPVAELLREDHWHVNEDGGDFMRFLLKSFLTPKTFSAPMDPWNNDRVRTATVGSDIHWDGNALDLRFVGNRVDVVYESAPPADAPTFSCTVNGKDPKDVPELYGFDRSSSSYGVTYPMPGVLEAVNEAPLIEETWTLRVNSMDTSTAGATYSLAGSVTGPDGSGSSLETFVSNSRRVRLDPTALTLWLAYVGTLKMPPPGFEISWNAVRRSVSTFVPKPAPAAGRESVETLFLGTPDSVEHRLRLEPLAGTAKGIRAIRVYSPAGAAQIADAGTRLQVELSAESVILSWPAGAGRGTIESANLGSAMEVWAPVAEAAVQVGERFRVAVPIRNVATAYRWRN